MSLTQDDVMGQLKKIQKIVTGEKKWNFHDYTHWVQSF